MTVLPRSTSRWSTSSRRLHVLEVQARGGLVQNVERPAGLALAQLARQLDALRFAARKRRGGLAQMNVAQTHVVQAFAAWPGSAG